jgi:hypothetical protein
MSAIYRISTDPDRYDSLLQPVGDPLDSWWPEHGFESWGQVVLAFNGQPLRHRWKAVRVEHADATLRRNRGKPVDFMTVFDPGGDAISQRALDLITPLVGDKVEALPLECVDRPERRYYLLNLIDLVDCLDLERSELYWDKYENTSEFIRWVYRYAFKPGSTDGHHLFRIVQRPMGSVLVSEEFKQLYEAHDLVGLDFYPSTEYLPYNATPSTMRRQRDREQKAQRRK